MKNKVIFFVIFLISENILARSDKALFELAGEQLVAKKIVDKSLDLVDIKTIEPSIIVDIKYATEDNIAGKKLYSSGVCYLRKEVAVAIGKLQKHLQAMGLGLKIWDGFRPMSVQEYCYQLFPKLFAKPNVARAKHPRGTAVDVTLVDKNGNELLMPTEFDATGDKARHEYREADVKAEAIENREVLKSLMAKFGFCALAHEWWHYDFWNWKSYDVIPLTFQEIEAALAKK